MRYSNVSESVETLADYYELLRSDHLKLLALVLCEVLRKKSIAGSGVAQVSQLPKKLKDLPSRKGESIKFIVKKMESDELLKFMYGDMGVLEQAAVQEALHSGCGISWPAFVAKYNNYPDFGGSVQMSSGSQKNTPSSLCLIMGPDGCIPKEVCHRLKSYVGAPKAIQINSLSEIPEKICLPINDSLEEYSEGKATELQVKYTAQAALHDVLAVLRLVEAGKVGVSAKTNRPSASGAHAILSVLLDGDFYPDGLEAKDCDDVQFGKFGIRGFAWPLLLQAGGLAKPVGSKLGLTRAGKAALKKPAQEVLSVLWSKWMRTKLIHELNRVDIIKGQQSKKRPLASAADCRYSIEETLQDLEPNKWVFIKEFFRVLRAGQKDFEAVRSAWSLYLAEPQYGSLGYDHVNWDHLNGRFSLAFLLEYAATLGVIDVGLVEPWGSTCDLHNFWGADNLSCLSRYDGLVFLQVNELGRYILGGEDEYEPTESVQKESVFSISSNFEITEATERLKPIDRMFLERVAEVKSDRTWRLSSSKLFQAVEDGFDSNELAAGLDQRNEGPLPETVVRLLEEVIAGAGVLEDQGSAWLVRCIDAATASKIADAPGMNKICMLAGKRHLVVFSGKENAFRKAARLQGCPLSRDGKGASVWSR